MLQKFACQEVVESFQKHITAYEPRQVKTSAWFEPAN